MVNRLKCLTGNLAVVVCVSLAMVSAASAAVRAQVDRPSVDLNESFMLEIIVDTNTDLEPDLTVLEEGFYVGQVSQLSNTSIFNGEIRRSRTWTIALMPKSTGPLEIPAIAVGNEKSAPLRIIVNEPSSAPPGEADVFVTSEIDQDETYVQAQILYRIKVYRAVATRQPSLREPTVSGADALIELAGEEQSYESILNGKAYNVVERSIAIYPQESGEIAISPARFEARVLRGGRITGRKVFESDAHTVRVLPIPAPPDDFPNAAWLPARDVQLSEEWSREPDRINAGEPVTRRVTISALGQLETQIPAIEPPEIDGLNIYEDKPELSRRIEADGIRGIRKDQYAMIGVTGGDIELPELRVPWWDIEAGTWRVAGLPARTVTVKPIDEPQIVQPVAVTATPEADVAEPAAVARFPDAFWQRVSQLLAAAWLLTLLAWWWSSREPRRERRVPEPLPVYKQQARLIRAARKAAQASDDAALRVALLDWSRLQWPENAPRSIGALAERVSPPLADELRRLSRASYGRGGDWDGEALARALRSIVVLGEGSEGARENALPPLLPPAA